MKIKTYNCEVEAQMRNLYNSLSEKGRRRYAAIEAIKLGYGGITYICRVLECNAGTVSRGIEELQDKLPENEPNIRQPGGDRKSVLATREGLDESFLEVLRNHTAGSPMDETVKWTNLTRQEIADRLTEQGFPLSVTVVDQLLAKHSFRARQAFKVETGKKNIPHRDEQFKNIERIVKCRNQCNNMATSSRSGCVSSKRRNASLKSCSL